MERKINKTLEDILNSILEIESFFMSFMVTTV